MTSSIRLVLNSMIWMNPMSSSSVSSPAVDRSHSASSASMAPVGFNPFRPQRRSPADYVFVAAGMTVITVLLLWAIGVF
jgi:hypothetical protein